MLETMAPPVPKDINEGLQPVGMTSFNMEDKQTVSVEQPTAFILKLFEMINDAPDEVIAWTPTGDAFIIGPDLKRLEGETLSQFFRHNRFQSLVRQLNFYSFRKINRERNMWVYKHDLFHRDRPEDLTLLRRRNGPTSREGRRRQLNDMLPPKASSVNHRSDDESTASSDGDCVILKSKKPDKKRPADVTPNSSVASAPRKRQALLWTTPLPDADNFVLRLDCKVDNSMMQPVLLTESDESDDQGSASSVVDELTNNQDQITVVLEVASQLDLHARRAMIGDRNSKSRSRRSNGVVTPSFAPLRNFMVPSGNLLTYDDEFEDSLDLVKDEDSHVPENSGFVSSDSDTSGIISACRFSAYTLPMANNTVQNIMDSVGIDNQNALITAAKVAIFCLSTSPPRLAESSYHFGRVSELLASCKNLSAEFSLYRSALSPLADNASCLPPVQFGGRHGESPGDATRVFRTFAINALQKLMACAILFVEDDKLSRDGDLEKLECALDAWQSFC